MSSKMMKANEEYYLSKGKKIYSDFSTFAQGKAIATCNAMEFVRDFSQSKSSPVVVCEYGVGDGNFAKAFLDFVKAHDKRLYAKTRYYLFDISEKMIKNAREKLYQHRSICIFGKFNAACETPFLQFDYCRMNELLTDLPAVVCKMEGGRVVDLEKKPALSHSFFIEGFLKRVEEGRAMPFNFAAAEFLAKLCLCGKKGFRIDAFDYGFYEAEEVFEHPIDEWNRLMVRSYGDGKDALLKGKKGRKESKEALHNLTVDLNIPFLLAYLSYAGIEAKAEKQKKYCEGVLGKKLELAWLGRGLDYVPAKSGDIEEDDGFYHIRIGR